MTFTAKERSLEGAEILKTSASSFLRFSEVNSSSHRLESPQHFILLRGVIDDRRGSVPSDNHSAVFLFP